MFKPSHLERWQVVLLTLLGAVGGFLLLSVAEVWSTYLLAIGGELPAKLSGGGIVTPKPPLETCFDGWMNMWSYPEWIMPIIIGTVLGAQIVWACLWQESKPVKVGMSCVHCAGWLQLMVFPWRVYVFLDIPTYIATYSGFMGVPRTAIPILSFLVAVINPALFCTFALWRYGVLLRRQAIKEGYPVVAVPRAGSLRENDTSKDEDKRILEI